jgi:hypothetical protein
MCCSWRPPRQLFAHCLRRRWRKSVQERWDGNEFESICLSDGYGCRWCCCVALESVLCCHLTSAFLSKYLNALGVCNPGSVQQVPSTASVVYVATGEKRNVHFHTMMTFLRIAVLTVCVLATITQAWRPILPRQISGTLPSDTPPQCDGPCAEIVNDVNACADSLACICTQSNANLLLTCVDCAVSFNYTAAHEISGQTLLNEFSDDCDAGGFTIPKMVVSVSIGVPTSTAAGSTQTGAQTGAQSDTIAGGTPTPTSAPSAPNPFKNDAASLLAETMGTSGFISIVVFGSLLLV